MAIGNSQPSSAMRNGSGCFVVSGEIPGEEDGNMDFWDRKWIVRMNRYQEIQEKNLQIAHRNS